MSTLNVPATRGKMGHSEYFTANFTLRQIARFFQFDPKQIADLPIEYRMQRALKKNRIPEIARYILDNDDYVFSSITVSVDTENLKFTPSDIDQNIGILELPGEAEWVVNDGQHRVAGIAEAISKKSEIANDTLSVVILLASGLERNQQVFSDLNRTVQKTSKSLDILFDRRMPVNRISTTCAEKISLFATRTDKERLSLAPRSAAFTTLAGLQAANVQLLGELPETLDVESFTQAQNLALDFWAFMTEIIPPWREIANGSMRTADARKQYVSSYALALWAIGNAGKLAIDTNCNWKDIVSGMKNVNWLKSNREWTGICMHQGEVITRGPTRKATAEFLKWKLGLAPKPKAGK